MKERLLKNDNWIRSGITILMIVSFVLDCCIHAELLHAIVYVSIEYQSAVFSGVLTFSTLSLTVISMIIGMMDVNLCGVKLRELLKFKTAPVQFSNYMLMSALLCVTAIPALAFDLCMLMTVIAFSALVYTTYVSIVVFHLVSTPESVRDLIVQERNAGKLVSWGPYIGRWINCYKQALQNAELEELEHFSKLLRGLQEDEKKSGSTSNDFRNAIAQQLLMILETASENMSFREALRWSFRELSFFMEAKTVCTEYLERVCLYDDQQLQKFDLPRKLNSLLSCQVWSIDYGYEEICYEMICALIRNSSSETVRDKMLAECIRSITYFDYRKKSDQPTTIPMVEELLDLRKNEKKKSVVLMLFYRNILKDTGEEWKRVYRMILQHLCHSAMYDEVNTLEIAACMLKEWCRVAKYGDSWNLDIVEHSKYMIAMKYKETALYGCNLREIVDHNAVEVVDYYVQRTAFVKNSDDAAKLAKGFWDWHYTSGNTFTDIGFAYRFYLVSSIPSMCNFCERNPELALKPMLAQYSGYQFPLLEHLREKDQETARVCRVLMKDFDPNTGEITSECMEDVRMIGEMMHGSKPMEQLISHYKDISMIPIFQAISQYLKEFEAVKE